MKDAAYRAVETWLHSARVNPIAPKIPHGKEGKAAELNRRLRERRRPR